MRLGILTAVCGAIDITQQWFDETIANCTSDPQLFIVSNGNTIEENEKLVNMTLAAGLKYCGVYNAGDKPLGSTRAYNIGLGLFRDEKRPVDVIAMIHNDLLVKDKGWDAKVLQWFELQGSRIGVAGFHGSEALGHPQIYQIPYELHQLARSSNWSNMVDAESHGNRSSIPRPVVTVDGMAMIAVANDLWEWKGFDENMVHHMYDHDLCLTARQHGRVNWMLPVSVRHLNGQTANAPRYNEAFADRGSDAGIHRASHEYFYEKWRGVLPARI